MTEVTQLINRDKLKAEIEEELPISQVAERLCGVELETRGGQYRGLCPLHDENSPSFFVSDGKNSYHCFGCKAGGDSIDLVRKVRNLGFHEALYLLAAEADIEIAKYERAPTEQEKERARLRAWCESLISSSVAAGRPIRVPTDELAAQFGVGRLKVPPNPPEYFRDKRYLLQRGHTLFPYRSASGRLTGWKLRTEDKRMYGTPDDFPLTEPALFGLDIARNNLRDGELVLVEGEFDTLTCHHHGFTNVAGLGGSAFNDRLMQLLERIHVRTVVFVFDGDTAGKTAAQAVADKYWQHPIRVRVVVMPEGEDPDSFLNRFADISFELLIGKARAALEWLLWDEWEKRDRVSLSSKLDFVSLIREKYGPRLRSTEQELVFSEVAAWMDVPAVDVHDFARMSDTALQAIDSERVILAKAIRDQNYFMEAQKSISSDDFYMRKHQHIWRILRELLGAGLDSDVMTLQQYAIRWDIAGDYIRDLIAVGDHNLDYHEDQIQDLSLRRAARDAVLGFKTQITDTSIDSAVAIGQLTHEMTKRALQRNGGVGKDLRDQVDHAMDVLHERMKNPNVIHGIDLGNQFPVLAQTLQGLQARRFNLLAATSGAGKSTMAVQMFTNIGVHQSIPVDFISLEMDYIEVLFKMASHMTGIDSMKITGGALEEVQVRQVEQAMFRIRKSPAKIHAPDDMCPSEFLLYAREERMQRRSEVFFLDYVQLISPDPGMERASTYEQYGQFSRMAKMRVARGMDCCVFCVAQLRRELGDSERPTKEDMGDSYQIVRDADVILILSSNLDSDTCDLWIDKNRQGRGNVLVPVEYQKPSQTFHEILATARTPDCLIAA